VEALRAALAQVEQERWAALSGGAAGRGPGTPDPEEAPRGGARAEEVAAEAAAEVEGLAAENEGLRKRLAAAEEAAQEAAAEMERVQAEYVLLAEAVARAGGSQSDRDEAGEEEEVEDF